MSPQVEATYPPRPRIAVRPEAQFSRLLKAVTSPLGRISYQLERRPLRAFALLTVFYAVAVWALSWFKLLWLDELITLHIARLASLGAIWQALANGADPNPPMTHILVHLSRALFGETEIALRLPAMLGYWVGMASLFTFLTRRVGTTWALFGTVLSMATAAFEYSYESRSYGIFYGFAMLAFLCWSETIGERTRYRTRWLAGMTLALAAGICTNYFAVLAFLPIALGEMIRTVSRGLVRWQWPRLLQPQGARRAANDVVRAVDWRVWLAMLVAGTPLLAFRGMIQHSIAEFGPYAFNKVSWGQVQFSYVLLLDWLLYPIAILFALFLAAAWISRSPEICRANLQPRWLGRLGTQQARFAPRVLRTHEVAGVAGLALYPVLGYLVASCKGGMLSPRFVIPVVFGFAIAVTVVLYRLTQRSRSAAVVALGLASLLFVTREVSVGDSYSEQKDAFWRAVGHLQQTAGNMPVAIPDPLLALPFEHYAPAALKARMVFPVDFPAIRAYRGDDSPEENLWASRKTLYSMPIMPLADFERATPGKYIIMASIGNWMVEDLMHHHYPVLRSPVDAEAGNILAFTPLCRWAPVFFISAGDPYFRSHPNAAAPAPFYRDANLPTAEPHGVDSLLF